MQSTQTKERKKSHNHNKSNKRWIDARTEIIEHQHIVSKLITMQTQYLLAFYLLCMVMSRLFTFCSLSCDSVQKLDIFVTIIGKEKHFKITQTMNLMFAVSFSSWFFCLVSCASIFCFYLFRSQDFSYSTFSSQTNSLNCNRKSSAQHICQTICSLMYKYSPGPGRKSDAECKMGIVNDRVWQQKSTDERDSIYSTKSQIYRSIYSKLWLVRFS